jgi:two-component system response regulator YesN
MEFIGQATDGKSGVEMALTQKPNIVFTDIRLKEMGGLEVINIIVKSHPQMFGVVFTTIEDIELIRQAGTAGARAYLMKPISQERFLAELDRISLEISKVRSAHPKMVLWSGLLAEHIVTGQMNITKKLAENIIADLIETNFRDIETFRTQLIELASNIMQKIGGVMSKDTIALFYGPLLTDAVVAQSHEEMAKCFGRFIDGILASFDSNMNKIGRGMISRVQEIIDLRINEPITLDNLAKEMYLSSAYLSRLFKKLMGKNFSDYLIERRLERAKTLLVTTDSSIGEIALESGYDNPNSFRRLFKSKTGMSASEYRSSFIKAS